MDRIKSAREIALEKVAGLGKASPEELRRIKDEESALIGEALAARYLAGEYDLREIESRLAKSGETRDFVSRALLKRLITSLGSGGNSRALQGILSLALDKERVLAISAKVAALSDEYTRRRQQEFDSIRAEAEQSLKRELEEAGISGSAVQAIPERDPRWQQAQQGLDAGFEREMAALRQELLKAADPHNLTNPEGTT